MWVGGTKGLLRNQFSTRRFWVMDGKRASSSGAFSLFSHCSWNAHPGYSVPGHARGQVWGHKKCCPLCHPTPGRWERGLRAGTACARCTRSSLPGCLFHCKYFLMAFPRRGRQNGVASGRMPVPKRGGGLEWFGSVLEADGLPLAGDSWLLHQEKKRKEGVFKGIGLAPKPKELLTHWLSSEALGKQSSCGFFCWWQIQSPAVSVRVWAAEQRQFWYLLPWDLLGAREELRCWRLSNAWTLFLMLLLILLW